MPGTDTSTRPASRSGSVTRRPSAVSTTAAWRRLVPLDRFNASPTTNAPRAGPRCPRSLAAFSESATVRTPSKVRPGRAR